MKPKHSRVLIDLLEECYQGLRAGESLRLSIARYPEHAAQLAPQLCAIATVRQARTVPARSTAGAAQARARFVREALRLGSTPVGAGRPNGNAARYNLSGSVTRALSDLRSIPAGPVLMLTIVFVLGLLATGTVTVSATAMPGQLLYPVKLASEQARLRLAPDRGAQYSIAAGIDEIRRSEAHQALLQRLRVDRLTLAGAVESTQAGEWTISGLRVQITDRSVVDDAIQVGVRVRGEVRAPGDGTLVALKLSVDRGGPAGSAWQVQPTAFAGTATRPPTRTPSPHTLVPTLAPPLVVVSTISILAHK